MTTFAYELRQPSGEVVTGTVQANSLPEATNMARGQGGYLLNVKPLAEGKNFLDALRSVRFESGPGLKDLFVFTNQLAVMIKAGINIRTAVEMIGQQVRNARFKQVIQQIREDVEGGQPFSDALAKHPKIFPPLYVNMVRASELSGNFAHMLGRISATLQAQVETRSMVIGAMVYPAIIFFLAIGATIFLLTWVVPQFTAMFVGKEDLLPTPTKILMSISDFLQSFGLIIAALVIGSIVGFIMLKKQFENVQRAWDWLKLRLPLLGGMFRALYITRGMQTMSELVKAGVPMLDTLQITGDVSGNLVFQDMWMRVYQAVKEGNKIADPLRGQCELPSNVVQMIAAGEESGNLGEVLSEISEFYQRELKDKIKATTSAIEPLMIVFMGVVVGFIAMSIMLPVFKMSSLAGK